MLHKHNHPPAKPLLQMESISELNNLLLYLHRPEIPTALSGSVMFTPKAICMNFLAFVKAAC